MNRPRELALLLLFLGVGGAVMGPRVQAAVGCANSAWETAVQQVTDDLHASPPRVDEGIAILAALQHTPPTPADPTVALRQVQADLSATPIRTADAESRLAAVLDVLHAEDPGACQADSGSAANTLHQVYASPVFSHLDDTSSDSRVTHVAQAIATFLGQLFASLGSVGSAVVLFLIFGVLIAVVVWRFRGASAGRLVRVSTREEPTTIDPHQEWEAAQRAANRGDHREAIRRGFRSALLAVAVGGRLYVDASWTNRELLNHAVGDSALLSLLAPAAALFEQAWYSGRSVSEADWLRAREQCASIRSLSRQAIATHEVLP